MSSKVHILEMPVRIEQSVSRVAFVYRFLLPNSDTDVAYHASMRMASIE